MPVKGRHSTQQLCIVEKNEGYMAGMTEAVNVFHKNQTVTLLLVSRLVAIGHDGCAMHYVFGTTNLGMQLCEQICHKANA